MRTRTLIVGAVTLLVMALLHLPSGAQQFGRNKVQYDQFEWTILTTEHFDVYYYDGSADVADAVALMVEQAYDDYRRVLGHDLTTVIPVIVYASHNDFQQTNVSLTHVGESVGGFTELFKNRVVVPFTGSYSDLRHVVYHELVHVFMFDVVYGGLVRSVIRQAYMNPVPLWFTEGLAEYVSQGWDEEAEMILRDLTVADRVVPLQYLYGGYLVYKEGQSVMTFIAERYGRNKIAEIVKSLAKTQNLERSLSEAVGLTTAELNEEWERWLKERYWPQVEILDRGDEIARLVTDHRKDGSYLNLGPAVSPDGRRVVYVTDRSGYADVRVSSTLDGEELGTLVHGGRSDEFEQLHILRTGFGWSPDGEEICFVAKSGGDDALHFVDTESGDLVNSLTFDLDGMFTPSWSPDGDRVVFVGTKEGASDLYMAHIETGELVRLTDDFYDERDPEWSPDGTRIAFTSDRGSEAELGFRRRYDLYAVEWSSRRIDRLPSTPGNDSSPTWSPDGRSIIFSSTAGGSPDLYAITLADSSISRLTALVGGASAPSWARENDWLVFSLYSNGGWDIAAVKEPLERLPEASGTLPPVEPLDRPGVPVTDANLEEGPPERPLSEVRLVPDDASSVPEPPEPEPDDDETVDRVRDAYASATGRKEERESDEGRDVGMTRPYETRFTPDWMSGGVGYSSGYGLSGGAQIAVSDILGNHRFYIATDFFSNIESSNFYVLYEHLARRPNLSVGVYNFKEYYYSERTRLGEDLGEKRYFSERSYGMSVGASYPFSRFTRLEFDVSALTVDRRFAEELDTGEIELTDETVKRSLFIPSLRLVNDTTLWGMVGPVSGGRSSISVSKSWESGGDFTYLTGIADIRRYLRVGRRHTIAMKLVAARSSQQNAQNFFIGGVNSLRGYDDFEFSGTKMALTTLELRYPFIDYLVIASPLPIALRGLRGVMFIDLGAAWDVNEEFKGASRKGGFHLQDIKASYGIGVRMNLGFFVIRVDRAWRTDLRSTGGARTHFALGAEF
ncbi:MAG: BamA/TamA family outer membrane protein [Candidatus Eisenbacteria bacterium]|nr:BamA/TamA family outer membrane protein [Candidatus Eisenbacteria bacterium]